MITISKTFEWDMGHRVTNHVSQCRNLHGHRYKMIVEIAGPINVEAGVSQQGMVVDFGDVKRLINNHIIDKLDHSFMYWQEDNLLGDFAKKNMDLKMYKVPFVPTAECIVGYLAIELQQLLKSEQSGLKLRSVRLFETPTSQAIWSK